MEETLVFEVEGEFGYFNKTYTTTSPLTYGVPSRTALSGLVSAILGYERDSYYNLFSTNNSNIGITPLSEIQKTRINLNLLKTKDETEKLLKYKGSYPEEIERIQVPLEVIKNPKYRIYLWLKNKEVMDELENKLRQHKSVYTPYLGISEFIAQFNFICRAQTIEKKAKEVEINSVIPAEKIDKVAPKKPKILKRERIPTDMEKVENGRKPSDFIDIIYEKNAEPVTLEQTSFYEVDGDNVLFF